MANGAEMIATANSHFGLTTSLFTKGAATANAIINKKMTVAVTKNRLFISVPKDRVQKGNSFCNFIIKFYFNMSIIL